MYKKGFTRGSAVALFLSLFLTGIVLFWIFAICHLQRHDLFVPALVFVLINLSAITFISTGGSWLSGKMGIAFYGGLCTATVFYTLAQFIHFIVAMNTLVSVGGYVLYHLLVLFFYLLIALPIGIFGAGRGKTNSR